MNENNLFDDTTKYLGDLNASRAAYAVAIMVVAAGTFLYVLKRSGFRAMVAVGK